MSKLKLSASRRAKYQKYVERKTAEYWQRHEDGVKVVIDSGERYIRMPEGYTFGESSKTIGGKAVKRIIGTKTVRKTRLLKDFSETVHTETEHLDLGGGKLGKKVGERERVSRKLKNADKAEYFYTSDDHAKKTKGVGKGVGKVKIQKETALAYAINAKNAEDLIEIKLATIHEMLPPDKITITLSNFRRKMKSRKSFRKMIKGYLPYLDLSFLE